MKKEIILKSGNNSMYKAFLNFYLNYSLNYEKQTELTQIIFNELRRNQEK